MLLGLRVCWDDDSVSDSFNYLRLSLCCVHTFLFVFVLFINFYDLITCFAEIYAVSLCCCCFSFVLCVYVCVRARGRV